jgi:hypothetical protein
MEQKAKFEDCKGKLVGTVLEEPNIKRIKSLNAYFAQSRK